MGRLEMTTIESQGSFNRISKLGQSLVQKSKCNQLSTRCWALRIVLTITRRCSFFRWENWAPSLWFSTIFLAKISLHDWKFISQNRWIAGSESPWMQVVVRQDALRGISSGFQDSSETEFEKGFHVLGMATHFPSIRMSKFYLPLILIILSPMSVL